MILVVSQKHNQNVLVT